MTDEERRFGAHRVWLEGDIVVARLSGPFTAQDSHIYHEFLDHIVATHGRCFVLSDMSALTSVDAEARRQTAQWNQQRKLRGLALYGPSLPMRALMKLVITGIQLANRRVTVPIDFFKDEASARLWIDQIRTPDGSPG